MGKDLGVLPRDHNVYSVLVSLHTSPGTNSSLGSDVGWQGEQGIALPRQLVCALRLEFKSSKSLFSTPAGTSLP